LRQISGPPWDKFGNVAIVITVQAALQVVAGLHGGEPLTQPIPPARTSKRIH
jgi:hypothetical protein